MTRPMYVCILYIKLITSYYIRCVHIRYMYKWPTNDDLKVALFSNASWPRGGAERKTSCFQSPKQNGFVWKEGTVPQNPLVHHFSYSNCDFSGVIPTFGHMQMGSPTWKSGQSCHSSCPRTAATCSAVAPIPISEGSKLEIPTPIDQGSTLNDMRK